jgi:hypothetical protein
MTKNQKLTCKMAGELLGFSPDYLRRLCGSGRIRAEKFAGTWVFTRQALKKISRKRKFKEEGNGRSE